MGVIKRQGIKGSVVRYGAIFIGFLNSLLIYPKFLLEQEWGLLKFLQSIVALFMPFGLLGMPAFINKYFVYFRDKEQKHNGFLFFILLIPLLGFLILLTLSFIFREQLYTYFSDRDPFYLRYLPFAIPILFFELYRAILTNYSGVQYRVVIPALIHETGIKIGIPSVVLLYAFSWIDFDQVVIGMTIIYGLIMLSTILYIRHLGHWFLQKDFSLFTKERVTEMKAYSKYSILGSIGGVIVHRIDLFMVGILIDLENTAVFGLAATICAVVEAPKQSLEKIAIPIIGDAWKNNDLKNIGDIYRKTSIIQFIAGLYIFLGIWVSIDQLFALIPNGESYIAGKWVIFILGMARLIDMVTGVNSQIITLSKYFRFNFYSVLLLAVFNIIANLLLVPAFHINGVALATLSGLFLYNAVKFTFIYIKIGLQPFSIQTLYALLIAFVTYGAAMFIPIIGTDIWSVIATIILKSITVTIVFIPLVLSLKLAPDLNDIVASGWKKISGQ